MAFAQYLAPLAFLEIYLRAQAAPGARAAWPRRACFFVLTSRWRRLFAAPMAIWCLTSKQARSAQVHLRNSFRHHRLSGVDAAVKQYQELKAASPLPTTSTKTSSTHWVSLIRAKSSGSNPRSATQRRSLSAIRQHLRQSRGGLHGRRATNRWPSPTMKISSVNRKLRSGQDASETQSL